MELRLAISIGILMMLAGLIAAVAATAWDYRPARFLVLFLLDVILIAFLSAMRLAVRDLGILLIMEYLFYIGISLFGLTPVWMLGQLFAPQWWEGKRPIIWISAPYLVVSVLMTLDLSLRLYLFFDTPQFGPEGVSLVLIRPRGMILLILLSCSYLVPLGILIVSAVRRPESRTPIVILFGGVILTAVFGMLGQIGVLGNLSGLVNPVPILIAITYVVLRSRLVIPTRMALDTALRESNDLIAIADAGGTVVYANEQAERIGLGHGGQLNEHLMAASASREAIGAGLAEMERSSAPVDIRATIDDRRIGLRLAPVVDRRQHRRGTLVVGRDVTDLEKQVEELAARNAEQRRLIDLVATLETPSVAVAEGVLLAPIVGTLDSRRTQALTDRLLRNVHDHRTQLVILDVSGVPIVDTAVAHGLLTTARALRLLGCKVVLSGISALMATTLVQQGVILSDLTVVRSPQEALARAG